MRFAIAMSMVALLLVAAVGGPGRSRSHEVMRRWARRRAERRIDADLERLAA